tara:strand:+ start:916 stop:1158 length:243 start_codon:yes stop_codon:yes gene_type:complete
LSLDLFFSAYSTTSEVMFPILVLIIILLIRDLNKTSKLSEKIHKKLKNISEDIEENGYMRKPKENIFTFIERYIKKSSKD